MELNSEVVHTPPRPAATIVLLRDADAGLEVFMIKRSGLSDVLGDAYVFPGGKVDSNDASEGVLGRLDTPAEHLHRTLGEPEIDTATAAGLFVAALRETFEEAGLLLSTGMTDPLMREATAAAREGLSFADVLDRFGLELAVSGLAPWSRWITPKMPSVMRKRFDTRFFVASVPQGLEPVHDDHEATHSEWVRPRQALERYRDKEEVRRWMERDPIDLLVADAKDRGLLSDDDLDAIEAAVTAEVDAAVAFAEASGEEPVEDLTRFVTSEVTP